MMWGLLDTFPEQQLMPSTRDGLLGGSGDGWVGPEDASDDDMSLLDRLLAPPQLMPLPYRNDALPWRSLPLPYRWDGPPPRSVPAAEQANGTSPKAESMLPREAIEEKGDGVPPIVPSMTTVSRTNYVPGTLGSGSYLLYDPNDDLTSAIGNRGDSGMFGDNVIVPNGDTRDNTTANKQNGPDSAPKIGVAPALDNWDLQGTSRAIGTVGKEGAQGAWGIAKLHAGPGASNESINTFRNQLLALNPELVGTARQGQRYYIPDTDTPQDLALGRKGDAVYLASRQPAIRPPESSGATWDPTGDELRSWGDVRTTDGLPQARLTGLSTSTPDLRAWRDLAANKIAEVESRIAELGWGNTPSARTELSVLNSQRFALSVRLAELDRQIRENTPYSDWTAQEKERTFADAVGTLGGILGGGAAGGMREANPPNGVPRPGSTAPQATRPSVIVPYKALKNYEEEFARQLAAQESALNGMTAGEIKRNIEAYKWSGRGPDGSEAIASFRRNNPMAKDPFVQNYLSNAGKNPVSFAALHEPDMVIGGRPSGVTGYGDMRVNSSIGSQNRYNQRAILDAVTDAPQDSYVQFMFKTQGPH